MKKTVSFKQSEVMLVKQRPIVKVKSRAVVVADIHDDAQVFDPITK